MAVDLAGGLFTMGSDCPYPEEAPIHRVRVDGLAIDAFPVTNQQFAGFVAVTRYETVAERPLDPADYPGAPPENLQPGSLVFTPTDGPVDLRHLSQWWIWTPGASWKHPEGPGSSIRRLADHPVVHVAHQDAAAYATWVGATLPTEGTRRPGAGRVHLGRRAAARRQHHGQHLGRPRLPLAQHPGKRLVTHLTGRQLSRQRVRALRHGRQRGEWTEDWWTRRYPDDAASSCCVPANPRGGDLSHNYDPAQPQFRVGRKVLKGGSHPCADIYCRRYRPSARRPQMIDAGMSHIGLRCVWRTNSPATEETEET